MKQSNFFPSLPPKHKPSDLTKPPSAKSLARRTHPETSKQAASEVMPNLQPLRERAYNAVAQHPGLTYSELSEALQMRDPRSIGRRLPELEKEGLLRRGDPRHCEITGKRAATWYIIELHQGS
jgi:hypothetical protein